MSWYQAADGREVWVPRDETVYTVIQHEQGVRLPTEELMYLSLASSRPVFKEQLVEDDIWDTGRNKKKKLKLAGKERGFVVRVEHEEHQRVVPWFKAACKELLERQVCSKIDADEATNVKKQKKQYDRGVTLGVNECRVETLSRCDHVAAGPGFKVEVACDQVKQNIMFFTHGRIMRAADWHHHLSEATELAYGRIFLARRLKEEVEHGAVAGDESQTDRPPRDVIVAPARRDAQHAEDEDWLATLMGASDSDKSEGQQFDPPSPAARPDEELEVGREKVDPKAKSERIPAHPPSASKSLDVSAPTGDYCGVHPARRTDNSNAVKGGPDSDEERRFREWEESVRERQAEENESRTATSTAQPLMKLAHGSFKSLNFVTSSRKGRDVGAAAKTADSPRDKQSPPSSDDEGPVAEDRCWEDGTSDGDDGFGNTAAPGLDIEDVSHGFRDTTSPDLDSEDMTLESQVVAERCVSEDDWGWHSCSWGSPAWRSSSWRSSLRHSAQPEPERTWGAPGPGYQKSPSPEPRRTAFALWGLSLEDEDDGRPIVDIDDEEGDEEIKDVDLDAGFSCRLQSSAANRGRSQEMKWHRGSDWGTDGRDSWRTAASSSAQWWGAGTSSART